MPRTQAHVDQMIAGRLAQIAEMTADERRQTMAPARDALWANYVRRVDPDGVLDDIELPRRIRRTQAADLAVLRVRANEARRETAKSARMQRAHAAIDDMIGLLLQHVAAEVAAGSDLPLAA